MLKRKHIKLQRIHPNICFTLTRQSPPLSVPGKVDPGSKQGNRLKSKKKLWLGLVKNVVEKIKLNLVYFCT